MLFGAPELETDRVLLAVTGAVCMLLPLETARVLLVATGVVYLMPPPLSAAGVFAATAAVTTVRNAGVVPGTTGVLSAALGLV